MIMFHTLNAPGSRIAQMVSSMPRFEISRYVGIRPPPKNMVMTKMTLKNSRPLKSVRDMG